MVLNTLVYIAVLIIVVILIIVLLKFLFGVLAIAPIVAYAEQKVVDKETITTNDTEITVTCTSNIPELVSCD